MNIINRNVNKDLSYLQEAVSVAIANDIRKLSKHGAVLVVGKKKYLGQNKLKTHPIMNKVNHANREKIYLHAEIDALVKALRENRLEDIQGFDIYVARVFRNGVIGKSKPCNVCMSALFELGAHKVVWTQGQKGSVILYDKYIIG